MNIEKFEKDMALFDYKKHREVLIYLNQLKLAGWTIENVRTYVETQRRAKRKELTKAHQQGGMPVSIRTCPDCLELMSLLPVNTSPGTQTGDLTDKSVWLCRNSKCMFTIYNKETVAELSRGSKGGN